MSFTAEKLFETILYGVAVASAFPIGALIAIYVRYSIAVRALFAAFGAGAFFAATMFLVQQALILGNVIDLIVGFSLGALTFNAAEYFLRRRRKNISNGQNHLENLTPEASDGRLAIIATVLDSVPETLFVGIIAALSSPGLFPAIVILFLGNLATTLEGAKIMHNQGISKTSILRDWLLDFLIVALAAPVGFFLAQAVTGVVAIVLSFAAGTLIVFIAGELIARAYRESKGHAEDLSISIGFIIGVILLFVL